jgi:hypothetical protein
VPTPQPAPAHEEKEVDEIIEETYASSANAPELQPEQHIKKTVAETPKVIGAWTDTILPDTVRTLRPIGKQPAGYAQTPHVNAGGWIDTPMVTGKRQSSALAPMPIEEETEEITTGALSANEPDAEVASGVSQASVSPVEIGHNSPEAEQRRLPPSVLGVVLEDDTFNNFGDTTMDSLAHLIDGTSKVLVDASQILQEHKTAAGDDTDFIDHLGEKLKDMADQLHDTRKGIGNLIIANSSTSTTTDQLTDPNGIFPVIYSTVTIPIPVLFHPRAKTNKSTRTFIEHFGRPTALGWFVIGIWTWYIAECFAAEIFCHPLYAEKYVWPPADEPEPIFPLVLPTLFFRLFGIKANFLNLGWEETFWTFFGPPYLLLRAIYRIVGMWAGWTDGFVDGPRAGGSGPSSMSSAIVDGAKTAASALGDGLSMMDDEVI